MQGTKRRFLIAGNWKMNKTLKETEGFFDEFMSFKKDFGVDVLFCVPFTDLKIALEKTKDSKIKIAAQNCHFEEKGAFTGEISANMLKELGVRYVLLGHSERRQYFNETDLTVNLRLKAALKEGLKAIVCVGETLEQRKDNITDEVIAIQIKTALKDVSKAEVLDVVIAYEPIWAIGTGENATKEQAQDVCRKIRKEIEKLYDSEVAEKTLILYGGSMKPANCEELLKEEDIDGGLIGGASLKPEEFLKIVDVAEKID